MRNMLIQTHFLKKKSSLFHSLILIIIILISYTCQKADKLEVISAENFDWLKAETERQLQGCVLMAHDGTPLYTPDGERGYAALWTRDFCCMVENAYDFVPQEHIQKTILYLIKGQRADGCMPDRVQTDGLAVYCAGPTGSPVGQPPLDNSQFMVKLVAEYVAHSGDINSFEKISDKLIAGMDFLPRTEQGLIYNDPENPHSPYGFTDTIAKTGEELFSSLLYWEACQLLAKMLEQCGDPKSAQDFISRATLIQKNLDILWDEKSGMYLAASINCRQIDIWGNAYAIYIGFPLAEKKDRII